MKEAQQYVPEQIPDTDNKGFVHSTFPKDSPRNIQERTFEFSCRIVRLHQYLDARGGTGRVLSGQLLRAGTSIGANLEEAGAGQSKRDFISKCAIALKEARETRYWLRLLIACEIVPVERVEILAVEAKEIIAILSTIVRNAKINDERNEKSSM